MEGNKMEKDIQLAYLWKKIILLAFSPSGDKDIFDWITCYSKSVVKFWEISGYPKQDKFKLLIENNNIPISYEFSLENVKKFIVNFYYPHSSNKDFIWLHDVDRTYFVPEQFILSYDNHMNKNLKKISEEDIKIVLEGLLFHPATHQHIEEPITEHKIRIGGGIHNPFQFLYHLRFQLCLIDEKREMEKNRLNQIFFEALNNKCQKMTLTNLFDLT
jgi:hypothetical protein